MHKLLFLLGFSLVFSQEFTITGKVLDSKTGAPIEFVNVYKENSTFGNTTNGDGFFDIYGLSAGTHIIIASYEGYVTQKKTVEMKDKDKSIYIEFKLVEKVMTDSTVLVEAKRIGKLRVISDRHLMSRLNRPPRYLVFSRTGLPNVNAIKFENIQPIREENFMTWLENNYTYVIIGAAALTLGIIAL